MIDLHIGAPKTGSTFIQEWLKLNKTKLIENGIHSLDSDLSHRIAVEFVDENVKDRVDIKSIIEKYSFEEAVSQASNFSRSIVSSEYFFLTNPFSVTRKLSEMNVRVSRVIAFLRRQDVICASGFGEEVKSLGKSEIVTEVIYSSEIDWLSLYGRWAASKAEKIILLNYDRHRADIISKFLEALGVDNDDYDTLDNMVNLSLNAEMTEAARLMNERGIKFDSSRLAMLQGWYPGIPFSFSNDITSEFETVFIKGNKALSKLFPGEFREFATKNWKPMGQDMTGRISELHLENIIYHLDK